MPRRMPQTGDITAQARMSADHTPRPDRLDRERMFVAVLDTGSFAAAAARLGTSTGQASKLVSRLEADLGVRLLQRTTRALRPTEAGLAYHAQIKPLIDEFDALDTSIRNASGTPSGRLRLTAPMSFGRIVLSPLLLDFAAAFPDIQLDVRFSDRAVNIVDEGFDLAIRIGTPLDSSLIARRLCQARIVAVASEDYLVRNGVPAMPSDLTDHNCIIDTNFLEPDRWQFLEPAAQTTRSVAVQGRLRFSNGETCLDAAAAGLGIARLPSFIAGPHLRDRRVLQVLTDTPCPSLEIHVLYPAARHLALKVRALIDFLVGRLQGQPDWDRGW